MAQNIDTATLTGYFKTRNAKFKDATPEFYKIGRAIPFNQAEKVGKDYVVDVLLRLPQGHTYAAGAVAGTVFTLNDPIALETQPASITGMEFVLRCMASYGVLSRSQTSEMAFGRIWDRIIVAMRKAGMFHEELNFIFGSNAAGIGIVDARVVDAGTSQTFTITQKTWAPGVWAMFEGGKVDVYDTTGVTLRTTSSASVTFSNTGSLSAGRRITLLGVEAELDTIAATDIIVPKGAIVNGWMTGIRKALTTISGNSFGISTTGYGLWSPTIYDCESTPATFTKILEAAGAGTVRGLEGKATGYFSTYAWVDFSADMSALRQIVTEGDGEKVRIGAKKITFIGPNGELDLEPHPMLFAGDGMILQHEDWERPGSTPLTFELPGSPAGAEPQFFQYVPGKAGMECQCYWDQSLLCHQLANQVFIKDILPRSVPV